MITVISNRRILNKATIGLTRIPHHITTKEVSIYLHTRTHAHPFPVSPTQSSWRTLVAGCLESHRVPEQPYRYLERNHDVPFLTAIKTKTLRNAFLLRGNFLFEHKSINPHSPYPLCVFVHMYYLHLSIVPLGNSLLILCS